MNYSSGVTGTSTPPVPSHTQQYCPVKRIHNAHSSSAISNMDLRELTNTLHELNNNFKRNIKVLTDIKDYMAKACEKQDTRPVDDNLGLHKLERVSIAFKLHKKRTQLTFHLFRKSKQTIFSELKSLYHI